MKLWIRHLVVSTLVGYVTLVWGTPSIAEIEKNWESPLENQNLSGIGVIAGWAYSTTSNAQVTVKLFVDNADYGAVACCSARGDVAAKYGSQALLSGFGRGVNFSQLTDGDHTLKLEMSDNVAAPTTIERKITVVRVGGYSLLSILSLLNADANADGQKVVITDATAQEQGTSNSQGVKLTLEWRQDTQALAIVESKNTSNTANQSSLRTQATAAQRTARADTAADLITANLENPSDSIPLTVGGKGLVSGWAFPVTAGASIVSVALRIDGTNIQAIPCCTNREDVASAYPNSPQALQSGFSTNVNFNELSSASHKIGVAIRDSTGASLIIEREATVVRLGNQPFLEEVDFSKTEAQIVGGAILFLDKIRIRASGSTEFQEISASFSWQESCQCFVPESLCGNGGLEPSEECDGATLGGESCTTLGFSGGTLSCSTTCEFETKACIGGPALYVTNVRGNSVSVIDIATNEVTKTKIGRAHV